MTKQNDGLFLLEVLIDKIIFVKSPCFSDKDFRTCINIECPGVEPLEICDDEVGACLVKSTGPFIKSFNNGKSCLFSLNENEIATAMTKYPVNVSVYKSLPCGCLPTKIIMGECKIDMTKEFVEARKIFLEDPTNVSYQALKDSFRIVGPDGSETGEIVMFLRISCFGKLIITRFQGPGGPPNIGAGKSAAIVDRSCTPKKDFQTIQDPCACEAARRFDNSGIGVNAGLPCNVSGGNAVCPPAKDPYDSMPCMDPDDPCYCSGPKPQKKQQMACRNTDQYCLHVPKDCCPTGNKVVFQLPSDSCELGHKQRAHFKFTSDGVGDLARDEPGQLVSTSSEQYPGVVYDFPKQVIKMRIGNQQKLTLQQKLDLEDSSSRKIKHLIESFQALNNNASMKTQLSKKHTNLFFDNIDRAWELYESVMSLTSQNIKDTGLFGIKDTSVYMTLSHNLCRHRNTGTQATASINKSFQVCDKWKNPKRQIDTNSDYCSTCSITTFPFREYSHLVSDNLINPEIYFFGKKKETSELKGMGSKASQVKLQKTSQTTNTAAKSDVKKKSSKLSIHSSSTNTAKKPSSTVVNSKQKPNLPAKTSKGAATTSGTSKTVTIKDEKPQKPCPALGTTKGDMMITVSHIKIGPKEICPVHGNDPCQGPKCVLASSGEEQGSVKVTTVNNSRRGVFEIVIRKLTGAPLAKNELMLEWTPPPSHSSPCNAPCPIPYITPRTCRHSKCKFIVCRPSPCRPKCSKKKACGQICCRSISCKKCYKATCCGNVCSPCKPCLPRSPLCCPPPQCDQCFQACKMPCAVPCKSSPCVKPCPIGRKRPRKSRSQPRIKSHHKKLSPCYNRSKACPVVRCRSIPGPCTLHCGIRQFCLPRNCSSILPCKLNKSSVESSLKSCSSCCG